MELRDEILQADDLERVEVEVPAWGVTVWVRGLTAAERDDYEAEMVKLKDNDEIEVDRSNARSKLLVRCIVDEDGERVFGDKDAEQLGGKASQPVSRLFNVAQELSAITDEDVDELVGNSPGGPPESSDTS